MTVTTNEFGQNNLFAKEPQMVVEEYNRKGLESPQQFAETYNGRWAMMGIVSGFLSYAITGKFFFGIFWWLKGSLLLPALHFLFCWHTPYNNLLRLIDAWHRWTPYLLCYYCASNHWRTWSILFHCIHACSSKYEGSHGRIQRPQNLWWFHHLRSKPYNLKRWFLCLTKPLKNWMVALQWLDLLLLLDLTWQLVKWFLVSGEQIFDVY